MLVLCLGFVFDTVAQSKKESKQEKKEAKKQEKLWKKRLKKLKVAQYKQLVTENQSLKKESGTMKTQLNKANDNLEEKSEQVLTYKQQVTDLRKELSKTQASTGKKNVSPSSRRSSSVDESRGVIFKVQLGAFRRKDLQKYDNSENFSAEDENGVQKYTIGVFTDYWEADTFKKYLREMGVKDAWVVSYKDGQRIPIKDVLEGVGKKS